ncbi:MAG: hypothetical protein COB26_07195 [Piscirickettsiaceae bacterium]|nr:MAG: hypothetical protein COB26_07195 [Piscirickettsiaceae bacterium]
MAGATLSTVYYDNDAVVQYVRALEQRVDDMRQIIKSPNVFQRSGFWLLTIAHRNCQRRMPQGIGLLPTLYTVKANTSLFGGHPEDPTYNIGQ